MKKLTPAEQQALHTHGWTIMGQPAPQVKSPWESTLPALNRTFAFELEPIDPTSKYRKNYNSSFR